MWNDVLTFFQGMGFMQMDWQQGVMLLISFFLLYLAIKKQYEPLLLLPIAFGMLLTNLPGAGMYHLSSQLDLPSLPQRLQNLAMGY